MDSSYLFCVELLTKTLKCLFSSMVFYARKASLKYTFFIYKLNYSMRSSCAKEVRIVCHFWINELCE